MRTLPVRLVDHQDTALLDGLPKELRLAMADVAVAAREGLLAMSVAVGLRVVGELLDAEITAAAGPKHAKQPPADRAPAWQRARVAGAGRAAGAGDPSQGADAGRS